MAVSLASSAKSCTNAPPSDSERSFQCVWENVYRANLSLDAAKTHLKGELKSWMRSAIAAKRGVLDVAAVQLDESDLGLLSELNTIVDVSLEEQWPLTRLVVSLRVAALSGGGLEL